MSNENKYERIMDYFPFLVNGKTVDYAMNRLHLEVGKPIKTPDGDIFYDCRTESYADNPLMDRKWENKDKVVQNLADFCKNTDYLYFTAKYILGVELFPYQLAILDTIWHKQLPIFIASRGAAKSYLLSVYIILNLILNQGCRIAVVGSGLRQSMILFNYIQTIYQNSTVLQDLCGGKGNEPRRDQHMCWWKVGESEARFLPLGNGQNIRGQRANIIISDETASIDPEIFETVVRGFAAVKTENMVVNIKNAYKKKLEQSIGVTALDEIEEAINKRKGNSRRKGNQIIMAGTAYYKFNHFYKYYQYYKAVIANNGKAAGIMRDCPDSKISADVDPTPYALIRLPYDKLPLEMMDLNILSQGEATMDKQVFNMEYNCVFPDDSDGFYLASTIDRVTCNSQTQTYFTCKLSGDGESSYVMGVDPASEDDNFAINILEVNQDYRGVVYQWATNRKRFEDLLAKKRLPEGIEDYNTFVIKHIRDLVRRFNVKLICLDSGGGGYAVREGLRDPSKFLDDNDKAIIEYNAPYSAEGSRILHMIQFSDPKWRIDAHFGLRSDIMERVLWFPAYDISEVALHSHLYKTKDSSTASLEDCYFEVESCKQETILIKYTDSATGMGRWDVPRIIGLDANQNKTRLKKDRFTSLLLSNWAARILEETLIFKKNKVDRGQNETSQQNLNRGPKTAGFDSNRKIFSFFN